MSRALSQAQLEEMVEGAVHDPNCLFYEESKMIPELSAEAGRRIYRTVLMVKYTQPGVTDWAPRRAQKEDIANNKEAYNYFMQTKADVGSPSIDIIPGIEAQEKQELIDYGILTITQLVEAITVPVHLQHVQDSAKRINEVLQHEQEENEQKGTAQEEGSIPKPGGKDSVGKGQGLGATVGQRDEAEHGARQVPETDRRIDATDVGQHDVPAGRGQEGRGSRERVHQGGRLNGDQSTLPGPFVKGLTPNWTISIE